MWAQNSKRKLTGEGWRLGDHRVPDILYAASLTSVVWGWPEGTRLQERGSESPTLGPVAWEQETVSQEPSGPPTHSPIPSFLSVRRGAG